MRLIFGASTAASAAVLAVFMAGLGIGGAVLGRRADRAENALAMYGNLEAIVALTAAGTPLLVVVARAVYLGVGGATSLGSVGATFARLLLSVVVLGPSTMVMGGTLPAAARAVERASDAGRQRVASLYAWNTAGAVVGTLAANFLLLEVFGTRLTLWLACLVNALVAMAARILSRTPDAASEGSSSRDGLEEVGETLPERARWFPPVAAATVGFAFMLMELVWYRMLSPLLGGSSYTFGLILAIALVGIGFGGWIYAQTTWRATLTLFATTCLLEALVIAVPYAIGDRVALFTALIRPLASANFGGAMLAWTLVTSVVVLPAALISGLQFPVVIGLYGTGRTRIARDVGNAYLANTVGGISGSIAGGFGLLPALSAPRTWVSVAAMLLAVGVLALVVDALVRRPGYQRIVAVFALVPLVVALLFARGPSAVWRHAGIGAGRADARLAGSGTIAIERFVRDWQHAIKWEEDGLESSVALARNDGYSFIMNGKTDGHSLTDAGTQVMMGMLAAMLHPAPKSALVVGLGTGSTAGWLGSIDGMDRVDVAELEPAIVRVARECAPVNRAVLDNPKVTVLRGDAREILLTSRRGYDLIASEPSNPYRAGISSLYTADFYAAIAGRLNPGGIFAQWIQAYEVDGWTVSTAILTLRSVFPSVAVWKTMGGDLLLVAEREARPFDVESVRARLRDPAYAAAAWAAWRASTPEAVLAHYVAAPRLAAVLEEKGLGAVNTDDQNLLEFAFARTVGVSQRVDRDFQRLGERLGLDRPDIKGALDEKLLVEERLLYEFFDGQPIHPGRPRMPVDLAFERMVTAFQQGNGRAGLAQWTKLGREPRTALEATLLAESAAAAGDDRTVALLERVPDESERELLRAQWLATQNRDGDAIGALERGFRLLRADPWIRTSVLAGALSLAGRIGIQDPAHARRLADALEPPFAVDNMRTARLRTRVILARATRDLPYCARAVEAAEPVWWDHLLFETRVVCYRAVNHPKTPLAEQDLLRFLSLTSPFGSNIGASEAAPR